MKNRPGVEENKFSKYFSWLRFNERILEEVLDDNNPLLERGKFLAITSSNLDEFFEVKVERMISKIKSVDHYNDSNKYKEFKSNKNIIKRIYKKIKIYKEY